MDKGLSGNITTGRDENPEKQNPLVDTLYKGAGSSIIRIEHLSKIFKTNHRDVVAVNDVTFDVKRGEIFGLLGPNGAGKSTLIRILTTLMKPSSGRAFLDIYEVTKDDEKVRGIIGVCPQNSTLDIELTAYDNLEFYGKLVNVDDSILDERIWELLRMADLSDRAHSRVSTLSGGMRRKLEIVRAFLHRPLILFLDEPTIGLDPEARREVWQQISMLNTEKITIILTTHYMDEAEKLCQRIAFVDHGRLVSLDTPENLKLAIPAGELIELGYDHFDDSILAVISSHNQVISVEKKEGILRISAKNGSNLLPVLINEFEKYGIIITSISIRSPSLEDVFLYLTGKKLDDPVSDEQVPRPGGHR